MAPQFKEDLPKKNVEFRKRPDRYVRANAMMKAHNVAMRLQTSKDGRIVIIGADSILIDKATNLILEKPKDAKDAERMLIDLSGSKCDAMTGVCVVSFENNFQKDAIVELFVEKTSIQFANLSKRVIESYVATKEPLDKAGSIGYQGYGASLIRKIDGCYWNVVGLPLNGLCECVNHVLSKKWNEEQSCIDRDLFFREINMLSSLSS